MPNASTSCVISLQNRFAIPPFDFSKITAMPLSRRMPEKVGHDRDDDSQVPFVMAGIPSSEGEKLGREDRLRMEALFRADFGDVRLHTSQAAAELARQIGARAYTVGRDIVMGGSGAQAAGSSSLRRVDQSILAHELAHVVQNRNISASPHAPVPIGRPDDAAEVEARLAATAVETGRLVPRIFARGRALRKTPAANGAGSTSSTTTIPAMPSGPTFEQVWRDFELERWLQSPRSDQLALQALDLMAASHENALNHGLTLAIYLFERGMNEPAERALQAAHTAWMIEHVSISPRHGVPRPGLFSFANGLSGLVDQAERLARADQHTLAFRLFGTAFEMLQFQLDAAGPARERELATSSAAQAISSETRVRFYYPPVSTIYDLMRRILGFYHVLEAEQLAAGNTRAAAYYSGLSLLLYMEIRDNYVWQSSQGVIAEVQRVTIPTGDALRIYGANFVDIDVTQLPGLPPPREVVGESGGDYTFQHSSMANITESLYGQVELLAELNAVPEIQQEFHGRSIDMNNLNDRLRVWQTMYGVYQRQDSLGLGALHSLMSLMGRYLHAFTVHTSYNVADFGTSYLANNMENMPVDLAGRIERDCGVYALTVAYEVFRTARSATPRLPVDFRLFAMPEHVTLVIFDRSQGNHYIVNNDQISPPRNGDVFEDVARAYVPVRGIRNVVTPAMEIDLGSSSMTDARFRSQAWQRYQDSASWGLRVPPPPPGSSVTPAQMQEETYRQFYAAQRLVDEETPLLHREIDSSVAAMASSTSAQARLEVLQSRLAAMSPRFLRVGQFFMALGPSAALSTSRPDPALQRRLSQSQRYLFLSDQPGRSHVLSRFAKTLLHFQSLGGVLSADQQEFISAMDKIPSFHSELEEYRRGGFPAAF